MKENKFNSEFSFYKKPIRNLTPHRAFNVFDAYSLIKGPSYKGVTLECRKIKDEVKRRAFKRKNFDYCTYSGTFSSRKDKGLIKHSELLTIDFDHVADVIALKKKLIEDEYLETELIYVSPSGDGIKCIITMDLSKGTHREYFEAVSNYIKVTYSIEIDESGKNVSRACFLCHDPDIFINPKYIGEGNPKTIKPFDPNEWRNNSPAPKNEGRVKEIFPINDTASLVEELIQQIESMQIDLTTTYPDWIKIGFAIEDQFGELGREYFHRVSQFHPSYSREECDRQFTNCLMSNGSGVGIGTFFQMCKNEGITFKKKQDHKPPPKEIQVCTFPKSLYPELPEILKQITSVGISDAEKDLLLLGSLGVLSSCLPNVYGIYDGNKVFANLYLFIVGKASAGKGKLNNCKLLVNPIHLELRNEAKLLKQKYHAKMSQFRKECAKDENLEKPMKPSEKMLFIPANNSASGAYQLLSENDGSGLIFETEGDTLAFAFKSDYGNYSDGFRKAFHHEPISYYRKTDREYVDILFPKFSAVLSGTPNQVPALIPSAENGLFSRFIFYYLERNPTFKRVFDNSTKKGEAEHFESVSLRFQEFYKKLKDGPEIWFRLTERQAEEFYELFEEFYLEYIESTSDDYYATIIRLGISAFRLAMILSILRLMEKETLDTELICQNQEFQIVLTMIRVLIQHSEKVFNELPLEKKHIPTKNKKEIFLKALPTSFSRQIYLDEARKLKIADKTADDYLKGFCSSGIIGKERHNHYIKIKD